MGVIVFLLFGFTDWLDGKIVRYREDVLGIKDHNKNLGGLLDAAADKFYIVPVLYEWGKDYYWQPMMLGYILLLFGYLYVGYKRCAERRDEDTDVFEHFWIGKMKFGIQIGLVLAVWIAGISILNGNGGIFGLTLFWEL